MRPGMSTMVYRGKVHGGTVLLDPADLPPDGAEVTVALVEPDPSKSNSETSKPATVRNGVPLFPQARHGVTVGLELVNQLRDATP